MKIHNVVDVRILKREYGVMRTLEILIKKRLETGELVDEALTLFLTEKETVSFEDRSHQPTREGQGKAKGSRKEYTLWKKTETNHQGCDEDESRTSSSKTTFYLIHDREHDDFMENITSDCEYQDYDFQVNYAEIMKLSDDESRKIQSMPGFRPRHWQTKKIEVDETKLQALYAEKTAFKSSPSYDWIRNLTPNEASVEWVHLYPALTKQFMSMKSNQICAIMDDIRERMLSEQKRFNESSDEVVCAHASAHYHYFAGLLAKLDMFYRK